MCWDSQKGLDLGGVSWQRRDINVGDLVENFKLTPLVSKVVSMFVVYYGYGVRPFLLGLKLV